MSLNKKIVSLLLVLLVIIGAGPIQQYLRDDLTLVGEFQFAEDIDHFVFYSPHQDDESIFFSQTVQAAIDKVGSDRVTVVLLSDGAASGAQELPEIAQPLDAVASTVQQLLAQSSAAPLTQEEIADAKRLLFSKARTNEFIAALEALGVGHYELHTLPDGDLAGSIEEIKAIIRGKLGTEGRVAHLTYSYYFDPHADHCATGQALQEISAEDGFGDHNTAYFMVKMEPATLANYYPQPIFYKKAHFRLLQQQTGSQQIAAAAEEYGVRCTDMDAATQQIAAALYDTMQRDGCTLLQAIETTSAVSTLRLGVGHLSVKGFFTMTDAHLTNQSLVTLIHTPF